MFGKTFGLALQTLDVKGICCPVDMFTMGEVASRCHLESNYEHDKVLG